MVDSKPRRLAERIKENGFSGPFFILSKIADMGITAYAVTNFGREIEWGPVVGGFIDKLGLAGGLAANTAAELSIVLPFAYSRDEIPILKITPKQFLYICGAVRLFWAASHIPRVADYLF